jgi:crossover junction endodeoxyribonuclease RusA
MSEHVALIRLSWPPGVLNGHAKGHWRPKAKATKAYRREAFFAALAQSVKKIETERPYLKFTYHPPDRRRRDVSNTHIAMKPAIDGICNDAMGIDDSFALIRYPLEYGEVVKGGCVMVEVMACPSG